MDYKEFYIKTIKNKGYNFDKTNNELNKLNLNLPENKLFQIKSAVVFLSRFEDEISEIVMRANVDYQSILIAATVKEERG